MSALLPVFLPAAAAGLGMHLAVKFFPAISLTPQATPPDEAGSQICKRRRAKADQYPEAQRTSDTSPRWTRTPPWRLPILVPAFARRFVSLPAPSCT